MSIEEENIRKSQAYAKKAAARAAVRKKVAKKAAARKQAFVEQMLRIDRKGEAPSDLIDVSDQDLLGDDPVVPQALYAELMRRTVDDALEILRDALPQMTLALVEIALDPDAKPFDRLKAIEMCHNRLMGPPKQRVDVTSDGKPAPWLRALDVSIVTEEEEDAPD